MEIISSPVQMTALASTALAKGRVIGLVPTMGFFHEGHLALLKRAGELADFVVVSLFVNPLQFGPGEDLARYPRDFARDCRLAEAAGAHVLFAPEAGDMYPQPPLSRVVVAGLSEGLCGASRPGHFEGVATVVAKLFNIVKPGLAVFGKKDLQQLAVIRRMVADLNWDTKIVGHPIVREADGLAMSSRNIYLSARERCSALCLHQAISHARTRVRQGLTGADVLLEEVRSLLLERQGVTIDYVALVDGGNLAPCTELRDGVVLVMAIRIGATRLIDNDELFAA